MNTTLAIISLLFAFILVCAAIAWVIGTPDAPAPIADEDRLEAATYRPGPADRKHK